MIHTNRDNAREMDRDHAADPFDVLLRAGLCRRCGQPCAYPDPTPIRAVPASGPGALAGYESRCPCGLVMRSSLPTVLAADIAEHVAYHAAA